MFKKYLSLSIGVVGVACLISCAYYNEKNPGDPSTIVASTVNWEMISTDLFQKRCVLCHGSAGGASFETYEGVVGHLSKIQQRIASGDMPPDSPLTAYEQTLLTDWISNGEPQ